MKVYAAWVPFGEPALSGRCKWVAPLVSLTHCAGVGPRCRKSDSGRSGRQASPRQANLRSQLPVATNSGSGCTPTTQAALFLGAGLGCPDPCQSAVGNRASASLLGRGPAGGGVETWPVPLCALVPPLF